MNCSGIFYTEINHSIITRMFWKKSQKTINKPPPQGKHNQSMIAKLIGRRAAGVMIGAAAKRMCSAFQGRFEEIVADTEDVRELTDRHIGKMFKINDKILPYPKALEIEAKEKLGHPYILLTPLRISRIKGLQRINNLKDDEVPDSAECTGLAGSAGAGKTVTLYLDAYAARQMGWITLYLPEGRELVDSSLDLNPVLVEIMKPIYGRQHEILKEVSFSPYPGIPASNLYELLEYGIKHEERATEAFTTFLKEIRRTTRKVFVGVDQWDAYSDRYQYEEGKYKSCTYHPIYRNFVRLSSFRQRKGVYTTAVSATLGHFIKSQLKDGYQELIFDVPQPTEKDVDTMMEYYIAQGRIRNEDKEHYMMLSKKYVDIPGGIRMISELTKGEDYMLSTVRHRTYNRIWSLLNRYDKDIIEEKDFIKKRSLEKDKEELFSTCAKIVFRKPGSLVSVPQDWVDVGIVKSTYPAIRDAVIQACSKFTAERSNLSELKTNFYESIRYEKGMAFENLLKLQLLYAKKPIIFPNPRINGKVLGEDIEVTADSYDIIAEPKKDTPVPVREKQLLCFYQKFPGIDCYLKCYNKHFLIQASLQYLSEKEDFVNKIHRTIPGSNKTPYELISECLKKSGETPLPPKDSEEYQDTVYMVYITLKKTGADKVTYPEDCNCKLIYINREEALKCFDEEYIRIMLKFLKDGKQLRSQLLPI
eukprot:TRINITY_DN4120_c0_g1_i2.p1 TRINITY_DN4120_c0_g1~~TRINITY_DN4120_c0_g1_i2.p1  ORF type:complete len:770 (-),score=67.48 TRINITY_DN4120_c0_g1_i2:479-2584(-)